jgi:ketosteroid isomerase-like protein
MTESHEIARRFFDALSGGAIPDDLLTEDMTAWTTSSGVRSDRARYQGGVRLLASIFNEGPTYTVDSLTAEDDRVAAEVQVNGALSTGEPYHNVYLFLLRVRDGRIASVEEHFNPIPVREKLAPLIQAALAGR